MFSLISPIMWKGIVIVIAISLIVGWHVHKVNQADAAGYARAYAEQAKAQAEHEVKVNKVFKKVKHEAPRDNDAYGIAKWLRSHAVRE